MGVRLPAEYQEVTCIIGQGAQYIDTGYVLTSGCRVQGKYNLYGYKTELESVMALFGARDSNYNNAFAMFNVTGAPRIDYGKTLTTHSFYYTAINNINVADFDLNAGIATVNGRTYAFADSLKPFTCPSTALIFAAHTGNTVDTRHPRGEIVYLKITDENGTVVRDMIPCYRKSDNKPGMYDLVSETFFVNQGTGEFLVGPDVIDSISPWMVTRRRALMGCKELIGYTANVGFTEYGYYITPQEGHFITGFIPFDLSNGTINATGRWGGTYSSAGIPFMVFYDENKRYLNYYSMTSTTPGERTVNCSVHGTKFIRFHGFLEFIDECYFRDNTHNVILWQKGM